MKVFLNILDVPNIKNNNALGLHIIIEFYNCNTESMNDIDKVSEAFIEAATLGNCNIVSKHNHLFEPHGISGVLILSESHISWHLWQERAYAAIDLFYCCDAVNSQIIIDKLKEYFEPSISNIKIVLRGEDKYNDLYY